MTFDECRIEVNESSLSEEAKKIINSCINIGFAAVQQKINGPFICGHGGKHDGSLPEVVFVCPALGSDYIETYKRNKS